MRKKTHCKDSSQSFFSEHDVCFAEFNAVHVLLGEISMFFLAVLAGPMCEKLGDDECAGKRADLY